MCLDCEISTIWTKVSFHIVQRKRNKYEDVIIYQTCRPQDGSIQSSLRIVDKDRWPQFFYAHALSSDVVIAAGWCIMQTHILLKEPDFLILWNSEHFSRIGLHLLCCIITRSHDWLLKPQHKCLKLFARKTRFHSNFCISLLFFLQKNSSLLLSPKSCVPHLQSKAKALWVYGFSSME